MWSRNENEEQNNVILRAIQPGGILHGHLHCSSMETLCCPQQSSIEASGFAPFFSLPSLSTASVNSLTTLTIDGCNVDVPANKLGDIVRILRDEFLSYHVVRFDSVAACSFTTRRGRRGQFSADLRSIVRNGSIGCYDIIGDSLTLDLRESDEFWSSGALNVFIISEPFMEADERRRSLALLKRAVGLPEENIPKDPQESEDIFNLDAFQGREWRYTREAIEYYRSRVAEESNERFAEFQQYMKKPMCHPIVKAFTGFLETVEKRDIAHVEAAHVRQAINHCMSKCYKIPFFADDPEKQQIIEEGLEKHIMTKIYKRAFGVCAKEQACDVELSNKLQRLSSVVRAKDLEAIEEVENHEMWEQAMFELDGMNFFKSPRNKFLCSIRAYQHLTNIVRDTVIEIKKARSKNPDKSHDADDFGANEFLPCFLLLVLRARPRNFYLNVQYVKNYHSPERMTPEESYCLATLESAVSFWQTYNGSEGEQPDRCQLLGPHTTLSTASRCKQQQQPESQLLSQTPSCILDSIFSPLCAPSTLPMPATTDINTSRDFDDSCVRGTGIGQTLKGRGVDVAKLLLDDGKAFEDLTVSELSAIVEEARALCAEKRKALQKNPVLTVGTNDA